MRQEQEKQCPHTIDSNYGEDYINWKDWGINSFGSLSRYDQKYFVAEIKKTKQNFGENSIVLEIGFGNGSFLQFAKLNGWKISGIEINENLVNIAKESDFNTFHTDNLTSFDNASYDLIVAFDVLEHIAPDKILPFLTEVKRVLKPNGYFIARFPNGDSPFGLSYQNGDVTHVNFIGSGKARYFANKLAVDLVYIGGEARPFLISRNPILILSRIVKKAVKTIISQFFNKFFLKPNYLSSNLIMILKKV